jgi:hypothetical protein
VLLEIAVLIQYSAQLRLLVVAAVATDLAEHQEKMAGLEVAAAVLTHLERLVALVTRLQLLHLKEIMAVLEEAVVQTQQGVVVVVLLLLVSLPRLIPMVVMVVMERHLLFQVHL